MAWIAGVDGCKGGWIAVYAFLKDDEITDMDCRVAVCNRKGKRTKHDLSCAFEVVMKHDPPLNAVAVDMPIGLWEKGKRDCDEAAQEVLGKRRYSVFPAPAAGVLDLYRTMTPEKRKQRGTYDLANQRNRERTGTGKEEHGKGLSRQSWALVPKIAEVASYLEANPGSPVYEVHPEVSFAAMKANGGAIDPKRHPMQFHKATAGGSIERRELLTRVFEGSFQKLEGQLPKLVGKHAALDDFYDALACLWTARRIQKGTEGPARALCGVKDLRKLSDSAPKGADGLPMRIVY